MFYDQYRQLNAKKVKEFSKKACKQSRILNPKKVTECQRHNPQKAKESSKKPAQTYSLKTPA